MPPSSKPKNTPTSPPAPPPQKSEQLQALETELRGKLLELRSASPRDVHNLTTEIQRLRVSIICVRELETGTVEPNAYKELSLLNKLLGGQSFGEGRGEEEERQDQINKATDTLKRRGISAASAPGILRALEAITRSPTPAVPDDDGEPQPIAPLGDLDPPQSTH